METPQTKTTKMSALYDPGGGANPLQYPKVTIPGYEVQYLEQQQNAADSDSDSESEEVNETVTDQANVDVDGQLGKAIAVWSYMKPDSITLFTTTPDDTLFRVVKYAEQNMGFNRAGEKIMVMAAGDSTPHEIKEVNTVQPGSVVMMMPQSHLKLSVEIGQLKAKLSITTDPMCSVFEIKSYVKKMRGIPIHQQDVLYRDKALENTHRLYEYRVREGSTLHVLIQVHFDLLINIDTFWGKTYRFYVDRCSTGSDIIYTLFGRTFSKLREEQATLHELYVPTHLLILQHKKRSIHWDYCLGYFGVRNGDTLILSTVGKESKMNMQTLKILNESGERYDIDVSQFDRWSVVAFILHGRTDVPVNLIRLYKDKVQLSFSSVIGAVHPKSVILMNIVVTSLDNDIVFGIPLKISLGNGIVENIKMSPSKTVRSVKTRLERLGVPNASMYELVSGGYKLPNNGRLKDMVYDLKLPMSLRVEKFPVFIHGPEGVIYKTMVDVNHTLRDLKHKIQLKIGHAMSTCRLLLAGQEYQASDSTILYEHGFSTRTSMFVQTSTFVETFFITKGNLLVKMKIPMCPSYEEIKRYIWACQDIPEGCITCLQTFLFWFFHPRINKKFQFSKKKRSLKRLPAAIEPLVQMSDRVRPVRHNSKHRLDSFQVPIEGFHYNVPDTTRGLQPVPQYKPANPRRQDREAETTKSWPPTNLYYAYPPNDIENWLYPGGYYPDAGRPDITMPAAPEPRRDKERKGKKFSVDHHIPPRWMGSLQQRGDQNRLVVSEGDITVGRFPRKPPHQLQSFPDPPRRKVKPNKQKQKYQSHAPGDNVYVEQYPRHLVYNNPQYPQDSVYNNPQYPQHSVYNNPQYPQHLVYNDQQLVYASTDDSEADDSDGSLGLSPR